MKTVEEKWCVLRDSVVNAGEQHLGTVCRSNPDWFVAGQDTIAPLLKQRTAVYNRWVVSGLHHDHVQFKVVRSKAPAAIRRVKNQWLTDLASQADIGREARSGNSVWSAIRNIQRSFRGLRPSPSAAVQDATGLLCISKEAQITRWHQHFQKVLNVESQYNADVLDSLRVRPVAEWLAVPPASDELEKAVASLSNNKAPGESGTMPEMTKCAGSP